MENRHRESVSEISGGAGRAGVKAACRVARVRLFANLYWDHPVVVSEVLSSSSLIDTNRSLADFPLTALMFFFSRRSGWLNSSLFRKDLRSLIHLFVINANADDGSPSAHGQSAVPGHPDQREDDFGHLH